MRSRWLLAPFAILALTTSVCAQATGTGTPPATTDTPQGVVIPPGAQTTREVPVFWLMGQSNAEGAVGGLWLSNPLNHGGRYTHLAYQTAVKIWWPGHSTRRPTSPPAWEDYRTGSYSPINNSAYYITEGTCGIETTFGERAAHVLGEPVYVFKFTRVAALHPDATETFSKRADRETLYDEMIAEWQLAAASLAKQHLVPRIRGILWIQGEGDFVTGYAPNYEASLRTFLHDLRGDLARLFPDMSPRVRFVIAEMHDRHVPATAFDQNEAAIRTAQLRVLRSEPNCALADVDDLPLDTASPFYVHYDPFGVLELGRRMFDAWSDTDADPGR